MKRVFIIRMITFFSLIWGVLILIHPHCYAETMSFNVGTDSNESIAASLISSSDVDTIELYGEGTVTLTTTDSVLALVIIKPSQSKSIAISGGKFYSEVKIQGSSNDASVVLENGVFSNVSIANGRAIIKDSIVKNQYFTPLIITGGSLILQNSTINSEEGSPGSKAISINGTIQQIQIDKSSLVTSQYIGIGTGNIDSKTIDNIIVNGNLHGFFRGISIGKNTLVKNLMVNANGHIFANGGAGVGIENDGGAIQNIFIAENGKIDGTLFSIKNNYSATGDIIVSGEISDIRNDDGAIDSIVVESKGKIKGTSSGIINFYSSDGAVIKNITVKSGGSIWGMGHGASNGIGIANMGGIIESIDINEFGYIDGGQSGVVEGYGIFNCYNNQSALIKSLRISGSVGGMDNLNPASGIGIYNRASTIEKLDICQSGTVNGSLAGIYNNYDQAKAEIKEFTHKGKIFSTTNSIVNSPNNNVNQAIIGSSNFVVDYLDLSLSLFGSLLRGKTDIGYVGIIPTEEIAPIILYQFSNDNKKLMVTCLKDDGITPIFHLRVGLFCVEDGIYTRTAVTNTSGQVAFEFETPFKAEGKIWSLYNFSHYDAAMNSLYSSSRVFITIPEVVTPSSENVISNENTSVSGGDKDSNKKTAYTPLQSQPENNNLIMAEPFPNPFVDVGNSDWFFNAATYVREKGLLVGTDLNHFSPMLPMTRGMFSQVLFNMDKASLSSNTPSPFTDVKLNCWYGKSILWAYNHNLMFGFENDKFMPDEPIRREQIAVVLCNYLKFKKIKVPEDPTTTKFLDDEKISIWSKEAVYVMRYLSVMSGRKGNIFDPAGIATRAEIAEILMNFSHTVE